MRDSRALFTLRRAYIASARQAPVRVRVRRRAPETHQRDLPGVLHVPTVPAIPLRHGLSEPSESFHRHVPMYVALAQVS